MSKVVEKTLLSFQSLIGGRSSAASPSHSANASRNWENQWSRKFVTFVTSFCSATSKDEELQLAQRTLKWLKDSFNSSSIKPREMKELLAVSIICELLGYSAPFAHIHAIKCAESSIFSVKRMGYLAVTFFLHAKHDLILLLINTLQKDLQSKNILEINMALAVSAELMENELISSIIPNIEVKLGHSNPMVRQKALYCFHQLALKCLTSAEVSYPKIIKLLSDTDASVMIAALKATQPFVEANPSKFVDMLPSLIRVQEQIIHRKLPKEYNYHSVPAPWCQIVILKMFSYIGHQRIPASNLMENVLKKTLMQKESNQSISFAIVCECVQTIANVESSTDLVELALAAIASLLKSHSPNLKYMGLEALTTMITKVKNCFASKHQPIVMECLQHPDLSIRLKTYDLLYYLCNSENIVVVISKFTTLLSECQDPHRQVVIIKQMIELTRKFSPSFSWFVGICEKILMTDLVDLDSRQMKEIFAKIIEYKQKKENNCVDILSKYFEDKFEEYDIPPAMIQFIIWVIQEFPDSIKSISSDVEINTITNFLKVKRENIAIVRMILPYLLLLSLKSIDSSSKILTEVQHFFDHPDYINRQYALEIERCISVSSKLNSKQLLHKISDKIVIDPLLSHQDAFVVESLESGKKPYCNRSLVTNPSLFDHDKTGEYINFEELTYLKRPNSTQTFSSKASDSFSSNSGHRISLSKCIVKSGQQYHWTKEGFAKSSIDDLQTGTEHNSDAIEEPLENQPNREPELEKDLFAGVNIS